MILLCLQIIYHIKQIEALLIKFTKLENIVAMEVKDFKTKKPKENFSVT